MRTVIVCMPRSGSKFLQFVLTEEQKHLGHVSTIVPDATIKRSTFLTSLEEFTAFHMRETTLSTASIVENDVALTSGCLDVAREIDNRLNIMSTLENYVVKHLTIPNQFDIVEALQSIVDRTFILRRKNIHEQALSFCVARRYSFSDFRKGKCEHTLLDKTTIPIDEYDRVYKQFVEGDRALASLDGIHIFMEDLIADPTPQMLKKYSIIADKVDLTEFGEEYGDSKELLVSNIEEIRQYMRSM